MAANISQRKARGMVLDAMVDHYRGWFLVADCGACGPRAIRMVDLPYDLTVTALISRMRCRVCCGRVATAAIDNGQPGQQRRVLKIWGPGSYG